MNIPFKPNPSDEFYTPKMAVEPLLDLVGDFAKLWFPCDSEDSAYFKILSKKKKCVCSHIADGYDATDFDFVMKFAKQKGVDCIITNPPFSCRQEIYGNCVNSGLPFALFLPIPFTIPLKMFDGMKKSNNHFIFFRKRIEFYVYREETGYDFIRNKEGKKSNVSMATAYWCGNGFIEKDIYIDIKTTRYNIANEVADNVRKVHLQKKEHSLWNL